MKQLAPLSLAMALCCAPMALAQQGNDQQARQAQGQSGQNQAATQGMQRGNSQDTAQSTNANRFVIGKLIDAKSVRVAGPRGTGKHRLLKLESRNGEQIIVDMGTSRSPSAMGFRQGDLIVAMGKSARINGRPVLYAHYVGELQDLAARKGSGESTAER